jgi:hypothetical protein
MPSTCINVTLKVSILRLALSRVLLGFSVALAFLGPMYEVLSQLCFLRPMLKFSVQAFYQPLFSIFPSIILFPSKSFPHQKAQSKSFFPIVKSKKPKVKPPKAKAPLPPPGVFYSSKQGSVTLQQEKPAFLVL